MLAFKALPQVYFQDKYCSHSSGDQNHGSPMMPQSIRSQTPGGGGMPNQMNPLPNNPAAMSQMRMSGSQGQVMRISYAIDEVVHK